LPRRPSASARIAQASVHVDPGGGAFYGPKLDINVHDAIGRKRGSSARCKSTSLLPQRFDLKYRGSDGADHTPVMIHRALAGSLERFFGVLIEHYGGAFPLGSHRCKRS
jgi:threonyl-tRNA synthetase